MANGVIIKIDGDDSGYQKKLQGISDTSKKMLSVTVKGLATIGAGLGTVTAAALKFSGELEQNIGGSEQVFKEKAASMQITAEKAFKNMGLSSSDFLATANKMGSLFQGAGFEIEEAADLTTRAMQRASDVASIMGVDVSWAMESIAGAAKGNFTMMDNLGVAMNDTTLQAYALEKGITTSTRAMTNQQKIALAMEMFLDKTSYAAGNYARENETLAGSLTTAKAALKNFISGTGSVDDVVDSLTNASEVIIKNIGELLPKLVEGLEGITENLIPLIPEILKQLIPSVISIFESLIDTVADMAPELLSAIFDGIGEGIPALKPLVSLIQTLTGNFENLNAIVIASAASVLSYKSAIIALSVIQSVSEWFKATQIALNGYTAALAANEAAKLRGISVDALLASTLTPLQLLFGVLTGKINLTTAATVALKAAKDALSGGVGILIGVIAAATAGIIAYAVAHDNASKEILNSLKEIKSAHDDAIKSIDDATSSEIAEAEVVSTLKNKLYNLDDQLKRGTLTQEEANEVQEKFKITANELNGIIPGIISNIYDENGAINLQRGEVDKLTDAYYDLAVAKAMANAYQEKVNATAKSLVDAKEMQKTAESNLEAAQKKKDSGNYIINPVVGATTALQKAQKSVAEYTEELKGYRDEWTEAQSEVERLIKKTTGEVEEGSDKTTKTVTSGNAAKTASTKSAAKEQSDILKEQREKELRDLKFYHETGEISDAEYYSELAKYRDKYFEEGSSEWQDYTREIYDYNKSLKDDVLKVYEEMVDEEKNKILESMTELEKAKDTMASKLKNYGDLYYTYELPTLKLKSGEEITPKKTVLSDIGKQNDTLKQYADTLTSLKERGSIPSALLTAIKEMSVDEGLAFAKTLLNASDEQFEAYLNDWKEKQSLSEQIANELYLGEETEIKEKFLETFGQIPEDFFGIGKESAEQYGDGFMSQLRTIWGEVQQMLMTELFPKISNVGFDINSGAGGTTNNYSATYNIQPSQGESTQAQLKAAHDYETLTSARGGYL